MADIEIHDKRTTTLETFGLADALFAYRAGSLRAIFDSNQITVRIRITPDELNTLLAKILAENQAKIERLDTPAH